jgi:hypothetical protein
MWWPQDIVGKIWPAGETWNLGYLEYVKPLTETDIRHMKHIRPYIGNFSLCGTGNEFIILMLNTDYTHDGEDDEYNVPERDRNPGLWSRDQP